MKYLFLFLFAHYSFALPTNDLDILRQRLSGKKAGAHQGGIYNYAPNTMQAFDYSLRVGADIIEMDLRLSKDGVVVVYHDEKLQQWTECRGAVQDHTLEELKLCYFRNSPQASIPTFAEVLDWNKGRLIVNAEFKVAEVIEPAMALVKKYKAQSWTYFQTQSDRDKYKLAQATDPGIALLFSVHSKDELEWALAQKDESLLIIEVDESSHSPENILLAHKAGKLVSEDSWHYNGAWEIFAASCTEAYTAGIDIAISNRPAGCVEQRNAYLNR